jgi:hypothetical protein
MLSPAQSPGKLPEKLESRLGRCRLPNSSCYCLRRDYPSGASEFGAGSDEPRPQVKDAADPQQPNEVPCTVVGESGCELKSRATRSRMAGSLFQGRRPHYPEDRGRLAPTLMSLGLRQSRSENGSRIEPARCDPPCLPCATGGATGPLPDDPDLAAVVAAWPEVS